MIMIYTARIVLPVALISYSSSHIPAVRSSARRFQSSHISSCTPASIADFRKEYSRKGLSEAESLENPIDMFRIWFDEACKANVIEPNAMCLSTCSNNTPSGRIVLLKGFDNEGFIWYTNYESRKGDELRSNPKAALTFWWGDLERSVRIEGNVEKVSESESDSYFQSRPRESQIGAWASDQSRPISDREALETHARDIRQKFESSNEPIERPKHWGGFRLRPSRVEFWKGREGRLHDRIVYTHSTNESRENAWIIQRLQP